MTGEWEHQLREMVRGKFPREKFMAGIVEETKGHRRAGEKFRGRRFHRARNRNHFADGQETAARNFARLQIAGRRVHALQGHRRPAHGRIGNSRAGRERRSRTARRFHLGENAREFRGQAQAGAKTRRPENGKPNTISATKSISVRSNRSGPIPRPARELCEVGSQLRFARERKRRVEANVSRCRA